MKNLYYYFFYRIGKFIKTINRRQHGTFRFLGYTFFSACLVMNILTFMFNFTDKSLYKNSNLTTLCVCGPVLILIILF